MCSAAFDVVAVAPVVDQFQSAFHSGVFQDLVGDSREKVIFYGCRCRWLKDR